MDDEVPQQLSGFIECALQLLGAIFIVTFSTPIFLLLLVFISFGFIAIAQLYRHAARDLKRIQVGRCRWSW
jgi:ATP-binding cassette subfamily C (CFTR/MRP) protein 1